MKTQAEINQEKKFIQDIYENPHKLGNILGYRYLQEEHGKWIKYIYQSQKDNTLLAFRGSYKTSAISVIGSIWYLFFNPDKRILLASSTHENAKKILSEIKANYNKEMMLILYQLIGIYEPKDMNWWRKESMRLLTKKKTTKEGSIEAVGALSVITSRHYDKIICDDLVVLKDRISKAERDRKKEWVKELQSIIEPEGTISYVGTPWHSDDIYSITPKPIKRPVGTVFNPKLTQTRLSEIRRIQGEAFYSSQYLLEHIAEEDLIFDNPNWAEFSPERDGDKLKLVGYLDPAFGGADFSALTIGGKRDKKLYVKRGEVWRGQIDITYDKVEKLYRKHDLITLYIENNAAQRVIATEFRRRGMHVKEITNIKNKHLRISDSVRKNWDRIYFSRNVSDEYMRQLLDYTEDSDHDDAPDSLAGLADVTIGKRGFKFLKIGADGLVKDQAIAIRN